MLSNAIENNISRVWGLCEGLSNYWHCHKISSRESTNLNNNKPTRLSGLGTWMFWELHFFVAHPGQEGCKLNTTIPGYTRPKLGLYKCYVLNPLLGDAINEVAYGSMADVITVLISSILHPQTFNSVASLRHLIGGIPKTQIKICFTKST